jgi:signal transduction histidine kinase
MLSTAHFPTVRTTHNPSTNALFWLLALTLLFVQTLTFVAIAQTDDRHTTLRNTLHNALGKALEAARDLANTDSAIQNAQTAQRLALAKRDSVQLVEALRAEAAAVRVHGEYQRSIVLLRQAQTVCERRNDTLGLVRIWQGLGNSYYWRGMHDIALSYYFQSLALREKNRALPAFNENRSALYANITRSYAAQGLFTQAEKYVKPALTLASTLPDTIYALNQQGLLQMQQQHYDSALATMNTALHLQRQLPHSTIALAHIYEQSGAIQRHRGRTGEARQMLTLARQSYDSIKDYRGLARTLVDMAETSLQARTPTQARNEALQAIAIAKRIGAKPQLLEAYTVLTDAQKALGQSTEAVRSYELLLAMKDSIFSETGLAKIAEMNERFETEKRVQSIALLTKDAALQSAELQRAQSLLRNFALGAVVLVLALLTGGITLRFRSLKTRAQVLERTVHERTAELHEKNTTLSQANEEISHQVEMLAEQNAEIQRVSDELTATQVENALLRGAESERERIARDLHDSLGQMLAMAKLYLSDAIDRMNTAISPTASKTPTPDQTRFLERTLTTLNAAISETRTIAHNLSPVGLHDVGLSVALGELFTRAPEGVTVRFLNDIGAYELNEQESVALYRIVQELFHNALKYSSCTEFVVDMLDDDASITLTAEDNGIGFDPAQALAKRGMGLRNLETRARQIGAALSMDAALGQGVVTTLVLPKR